MVVAVSYAKIGYKVLLFEKDKSKVESLQNKQIHFFEPGLEKLFLEVMNKNLFLIETMNDFFQNEKVDIIYSCVPTPSLNDGHADTSIVEAVYQELAVLANYDVLLISKSTMPPGCNDLLFEKVFKNNHFVKLIYSPEFLRQGEALLDFSRPDRVVFGLDKKQLLNESLKKKLMLLAGNFIAEERVLFVDFVTAELIKHASNAMLASRVTFMNQIFRISKALSADMKMVQLGVGLDHRIGINYLEAGAGFGGSCLPKDLLAIIKVAEDLSVDSSYLKSISNFNTSQVDWFYENWRETVGEIKGNVVAVKGVSFKECTSDLRNSVQVELVKKIMADGPKDILLLDKSLNDVELAQIRYDLGLPNILENNSDQNKTVLLFRNL
jgi:UDPglucose 6-dehydrogenase